MQLPPALVLVVLLLPGPAYGQVSEDLLKAVLIEKITRFVTWPEQSALHGSAPAFRACMMEKGALGRALEQLADVRQIKDKPIEVRQLRNIKALGECDLLVVSKRSRYSLNTVLKAARQYPVLTIADAEGYAGKGVMFNFFIRDARLGFEVNLAMARAQGFTISSRLLKLARIVESGDES